jgi:predicted RNA binding protein YcfA (HicA-like mRNA interferase family)
MPRRPEGSHKRLTHPDYPNGFTFAFHDGEEIGPKMLARVAKRTGLKPSDL